MNNQPTPQPLTEEQLENVSGGCEPPPPAEEFQQKLQESLAFIEGNGTELATPNYGSVTQSLQIASTQDDITPATVNFTFASGHEQTQYKKGCNTEHLFL